MVFRIVFFALAAFFFFWGTAQASGNLQVFNYKRGCQDGGPFLLPPT